MTNSTIEISEKKSGTKYTPRTKYEIETGSDLESNAPTGSMKNFPTAFIRMKELEESLEE